MHKKPHATCKMCQRVLSAQQAAASEKEAARTRSVAAEESTRPTFNCSPMLKDQILKCSYFKSLLSINSVEALAEEINGFADGVDVYQAGSATLPSIFFCCVYRLFTMEHTEEELETLLDHLDSAYVRCVGFLYIRYSVRPDRLWELLEEYVLDDMEFRLGKGEIKTTIGEYVESLLIKEKYFGTPLPRIPVAVRRKLEDALAPLPQYRKRSQANRRALKLLREEGTLVEVCSDSRWSPGRVVEFSGGTPSRPKLRVALLNGARADVVAHIGMIVLRRGSRSRSRSRSRRRGRSPDWTRWKGKSDDEMKRELRERQKEEAVCGQGKEYAKRLMGFEAGLALRREQGSAESKLMEEDTFVSVESRQQRRRPTEEDEEERDRQHKKRIDEEEERQRKLQHIYQKYGGQQSAASAAGGSCAPQPGGARGDVEGPDVMRLG